MPSVIAAGMNRFIIRKKTQPSGGGIKNREQDGKWRIMMKFINNEKILEKYKKRYYNAQ